MRLYPISGHIKYAHFADSSDLQIDIGLLPENSMELQEITLPPLEKNLMYKIRSLLNRYAEEISLMISEETWEVGKVCEFTISYVVQDKLIQEVTVAYKSRYNKLSETVKPTLCIWHSKENKVAVYNLEEGLEVALKSISNLNIRSCMDDSYRLSLDEAISHAEEVAERLANSHINSGEDCKLCAIEHQQLADWLKELRLYRELEVFKSLKTETGHVIELSSDKTSGERDGLIGIAISGTDHLFNIHLTAKDFSKASKAFLEGKKVKVDVCEFMSLEGRNLEILDM